MLSSDFILGIILGEIRNNPNDFGELRLARLKNVLLKIKFKQ